jgi:hypothetical protein
MASSYAIRLNPEQSISIYGIWDAKTTLTWCDITRFHFITLKKCVCNGVCSRKLYRMQPDIKEWIKNEKVFIEDFELISEWHANPFRDFHCNVGDLVVHRKYITPSVLINCNINFTILKNDYGLTPELMVLLRYNVNDWITLGLTEEFVEMCFENENGHMSSNAIHNRSTIVSSLFGMLSKNDILNLIRRAQKKQ